MYWFILRSSRKEYQAEGRTRPDQRNIKSQSFPTRNPVLQHTQPSPIVQHSDQSQSLPLQIPQTFLSHHYALCQVPRPRRRLRYGRHCRSQQTDQASATTPTHTTTSPNPAERLQQRCHSLLLQHGQQGCLRLLLHLPYAHPSAHHAVGISLSLSLA